MIKTKKSGEREFEVGHNNPTRTKLRERSVYGLNTGAQNTTVSWQLQRDVHITVDIFTGNFFP